MLFLTPIKTEPQAGLSLFLYLIQIATVVGFRANKDSASGCPFSF
jgi:hypothetical protein